MNETTINLSDYTLLNKVGSGSFGEVFKIKDNKTNEIYAAKISIRENKEILNSDKLNLKRELVIMSKINHPGVVKFIGYSPVNFKNEEKPIIITEFIPNGTLEDVIKKERNSISLDKWDDTHKLMTIYGIASAMNYLHLCNIIHRDLKPANILMDKNLCPKIADFGLSKIRHHNEESITAESITGIKGTPIYISPEIWDSSEYSPACDVYAFAFIVYELITNERPYKDCQLFQILAKITNGIRPDFKFEIPESYKNLIERCWDQNPNNRYSFAEILQMLKNDPGFITDLIDQDEFLRYVDSIDGNQIISSLKNTPTKQDQKVVEEKSSENKPTAGQKIVEVDDSISDIKSDEDLEDIFLKALNYALGDGVPVNLEEAARLYKIAADNGHQYAIYNYAEALFYGKGVTADKKKAFEYFKKAADIGLDRGMYSCGIILYDLFDDKEEAVKYFKMAALNGNVSGMLRYAIELSKEGPLKNLEEANVYFKMAADKGNIQSIYCYASFCYGGHGTAVNKEEAAKYFKIGADFGNIDCILNYASMKATGDGVPIDIKEAIKYYKMGADIGNKEALDKYNLISKDNDPTIVNEKLLYYDLKNKADKGELDSIKELASRLFHGTELTKNIEEAAYYYKIGADMNDEYCCHSYASIMYGSYGIPTNMPESLKYYKKAADLGNIESMHNYAFMNYNGEGVPTNLTEAAIYFKKAADNDFVGSMNYIGRFYEEGIGVQQNKSEAAKYYKMASDHGNQNGKKNYEKLISQGSKKDVDINSDDVDELIEHAKALLNGNGDVSDKNEAIRYLDIAVEKSDAMKAGVIATMLFFGHGVPIDKNLGAKYFKIGADKGNLDCMINYYTIMYGYEGVEKNIEERTKYCKMAADHGDLHAMYNHALNSFKGTEIPLNYDDAVKYSRMGVEKGNAECMILLGILYESGKGVPINKKEALKYYKMGADLGNELSKEKYENLKKEGY